MITLYGVTEDGTTVPVQVTEDGKLVVHKEGGYTPGMDLEAGTITSGNIQSSGNVTAASYLRSDTSLDPSTDQSRQGRWTLNPGASLNVANFVDRSSGEEVTTVGITRVGDITTQGGVTTSGSIVHSAYNVSSDDGLGCQVRADGAVCAAVLADSMLEFTFVSLEFVIWHDQFPGVCVPFQRQLGQAHRIA